MGYLLTAEEQENSKSNRLQRDEKRSRANEFHVSFLLLNFLKSYFLEINVKCSGFFVRCADVASVHSRVLLRRVAEKPPPFCRGLPSEALEHEDLPAKLQITRPAKPEKPPEQAELF